MAILIKVESQTRMQRIRNKQWPCFVQKATMQHFSEILSCSFASWSLVEVFLSTILPYLGIKVIIKIINKLELERINMNAKINTQVLETHVKDVLTSAKSKLTDLNKDIDKLTKENDDI